MGPLSSEFTMRTSLRHYWRDGPPVMYGWPFARTTMTHDGLLITLAAWLPIPNSVRISAGWTEIDRVERVSKGLRFVFKGDRKAVVVASLYKPERLIDAASRFPVTVDRTLHPSKWFEI